ncbi:MAG: M20/M25/M40 family metallo-hydrolase [Candidatus Hadarchaeia archaeon]
MTDFEIRRSFEHLDRLSYEIGPRLAGGDRSRKAADYIREKFEEFGLETELQEFEFAEGVLHFRLRSLVLLAAFVPVFFLNPWISILVLAGGYALAFKISYLIPQKSTANVLGILEPENGAERRVVLGAHYDSARASKGRRWTILYRLFFLPVLISFFLLSILRFLIPGTAWIILMGILAIPYFFVFLLPFWVFSDLGAPGANDNASGVAVLLEAARVLSDSPPEETRIDFVAFGAEEQGLKGSKFFAENTGSFDYLLNLDSVGGGDLLSFVEGNGVIRTHETDKDLNERLREEFDVEGFWAPFSGHDHVPLLKRGFGATTLTSRDDLEKNALDQLLEDIFGLENVRTMRHSTLHSLEDVPDDIKLDNIGRSGDIVLSLVGDEE